MWSWKVWLKYEVKREINFYNLDAILSVGYRVNSSQATQFRIWAIKILKEYIIKGFAMDDDRNSQTTKDFYATVQNKFHFAITGKTAAEIVYENADISKPHMGLSTWKNSPNGRVLKSV